MDDATHVPASILTYVAKQLDLTALPMDIGRYWHGRTHWHHQDAIVRQYHYHAFDAQPGHWRFVRWLYTRAWTAAERPSVLFDQATAYLLDQKILLPGVSMLTRLVAQVRDRTQARLWRRLAAMPDAAQRDQLASWLQAPAPGRPTPLDDLRHPPTRISRTGFREAAERLNILQTVHAERWDLHALPTARFRPWPDLPPRLGPRRWSV